MKSKLKIVLCAILTILIFTSCTNNKINDTQIELDNDIIKNIEQSEIETNSFSEQVTTEPIVEEYIKEDTKENENIIEIESDKGVDANQAVQPVSLGTFRLTAYCSCTLCCGKWAENRPVDENGNEIVYGSIEERLQEGYSIAVDPIVIPYRTEVIINGHTYKAQDCGSAIKGNRIDIYMPNHQDALNFGVQYAEVFIMPN